MVILQSAGGAVSWTVSPQEENFDLHLREHAICLFHRYVVQKLMQWFVGLERNIT